MDKVRLAIFASGAGSNADNISRYFKDHEQISVALILTNKAEAGVIQVAEKHQIKSIHFPFAKWKSGDEIVQTLKDHHITHLVLAGFLLLIPPSLLDAFPDRIINVHPALLPKYGGKGMFGRHVHEAVKAAGETQTGITIHRIDEQYDEGDIIFQKEVGIAPEDSIEVITRKVHKLEYQYFPPVIERWALTGQYP